MSLLDRIRRAGPVSFEEFMEWALYDPDHGFYSTGGSAGRRGDFITSVEVGPLFARVIARALDTWWTEMGKPDPFFVIEAAAGSGALARGILRAEPACSPALRYVLVERSELLRERLATAVPLELPANLFGPSARREPEEDAEPVAGQGPLMAALGELPAEPVVGVVLANELLDNLPIVLLERAAEKWCEVRVGERDGALVEVVVPASDELAAEADALAAGAPTGCRIPLQRAVRSWLASSLHVLERGRVVTIDYADATPSMARRPWTEWLRTYRAQDRGDYPLDRPGTQDITCEVAVDQLRPRPDADRAQAEFLWAHGIDELVEEGRRLWAERAHIGDLAAVEARSRVSEAAALTDRTGLGSFRVLEWTVS